MARAEAYAALRAALLESTHFDHDETADAQDYEAVRRALGLLRDGGHGRECVAVLNALSRARLADRIEPSRERAREALIAYEDAGEGVAAAADALRAPHADPVDRTWAALDTLLDGAAAPEGLFGRAHALVEAWPGPFEADEESAWACAVALDRLVRGLLPQPA